MCHRVVAMFLKKMRFWTPAKCTPSAQTHKISMFLKFLDFPGSIFWKTFSVNPGGGEKKDARRGALNARGGHLRGFNLRWAAPWWISHSALLTGKTMNTSSPFFPFFRPKISFPEIGHRSNTFFPWWKTPIASYQIPKKAPTSTMKSPKNCWVVSGFRSQQHLSHTHQFVNSNSVDDDHPQSMLSIIINQQGLHYQIYGELLVTLPV